MRPGPIVGQLVHPIIRRRHQGEPIVCLDPEVHERLLPILEQTYGVVLFQEQMLACAMGFSRGTERLERGLNNLRKAMRKHGWSDCIIEMLIESASNFALYGFPESHSMSFALLAYASTWLKAHRPAEFVASLLNNQPMGFYGPATLVQDSRRHGVKFLPVCVQRSDWECTVESAETDAVGRKALPTTNCWNPQGGSDFIPDISLLETNVAPPTKPPEHIVGQVRLGLCYLKRLSEKNTRAMLTARAERPFTDIDDWLRRTGFSAADRRILAAPGALNSFAEHRRAALWQIEAAWSADEPLLQRAASEQPKEQALPAKEQGKYQVTEEQTLLAAEGGGS